MPKWYANNTERVVNIAAHTMTWAYVFISPLFFARGGHAVNWPSFFLSTSIPLGAFIGFYINYFLLVPRFILERKEIKWFVFWNLLLLVLLSCGVEVCMTLRKQFETHPHPFPLHPHHTLFPPQAFFAVRHILTYIGVAAIALMLRLSLRWRESEQARSAAELRHLKSQLHPHFLLNTLNNIYALTTLDVAKSQQAILGLGNMLRYMLYEDTGQKVKLSREVKFLDTYIELMRLRLNDSVDVRFEKEILPGADPEVAPLIFISLVENAFKHGIHSSEPSFVHILLRASHEAVHFECCNTNFPKSPLHDKQPGGIGLHQVGQRLQLAYPYKQHHWTYGVEDGVYRSVIDLNVKP